LVEPLAHRRDIRRNVPLRCGPVLMPQADLNIFQGSAGGTPETCPVVPQIVKPEFTSVLGFQAQSTDSVNKEIPGN